ncbi:MAG: LytTR family transcriptional regulator DNA-binding domain-containing protein [Lachnospiraceae bacterium]|nr:LytTR family transcriptional regulator DNA-binding domain-containing protein [Lachnospiraceae bacterium]
MKVTIERDQKENVVFAEIHCREVTEDVSRLERHIRNFDTFIAAKEDGSNVNVSIEDIYYIESVDKKTFIYTEKNVSTTDKRLYELEELLDNNDFFRCSKSMIVHLNKVVSLKPEITRNIRATLKNGEIVVISRRYATELKKLLGIGG